MKQTPIRRVSKKMAKQLRLEGKLIDELLDICGGICECCGRAPDWRGLRKHEAITRKRGGDPTDRLNCIMVCGDCHNHVKYPVTGTPLSTERQLEIAAERGTVCLD